MGQQISHTVAVVGAGVVGLLTAWQLRLRGYAVTVIDPAPGSEASFAAAGMLAPVSEVQYGQDALWPLMTAASNEYPPLLETLRSAAGTSTGYFENGSLQVAADPGDRAAIAELVSVQREAGLEVQPLTSSALRRREPGLTPGLAKAWDTPSDHQVDPRILMTAARTALDADLTASHPQAGPAARWVAKLVTQVEIHQDDDGERSVPNQRSDPHQVTIFTDDGEQQHFGQAVLAAGIGYNRIAGVPQTHPLPLREVHGDVLRLRVRAEQLLPGETHVLNATVRAKVAGRSVYLVPREDGGMVIGASSREDGLAGTHAGSVAELLEDAITVLPAVREMELVEITSRARPGTPDDVPYLGYVGGSGPSGGAGQLGQARELRESGQAGDRSAVVVSTGYFRHGILLAPLAARLTAALVDGARSGGTGLDGTGSDGTGSDGTGLDGLGDTDLGWLQAMSPYR